VTSGSKSRPDWSLTIVALGILLVLIGLLLLLDSLGLIEDVGFGELWPLILVAIGVAIIYERVRRSWRRRH
jgi:uncharacterized sodium:solute symporter family permease YidK